MRGEVMAHARPCKTPCRWTGRREEMRWRKIAGDGPEQIGRAMCVPVQDHRRREALPCRAVKELMHGDKR